MIESPEAQLMLMLDMCMDAEERCIQRIAQARINGDFRQAAFDAQLREQYGQLKRQVMEAIRHNRSDTADLDSSLQRLNFADRSHLTSDASESRLS